MNKSKAKQPTKEQKFLKLQADRLASCFRDMYTPDSSDDEKIAIGRIQALRSVMGDLANISDKTLVTKIEVTMRTE